MNSLEPVKGRSSGFTLIEVLVAVALTAFVAVISAQFISATADAYEQHSAHSKRLDEINLFFSILSRDLMHAVDRPIRDEYGDTQEALSGGQNAEYLLVMTRGGWPNPRGMPRSALQRVAYGLNNDALERVSWVMLDRSDSDQIIKATAITGVNNVAIRFLHKNDVIVDDDRVAKEWHDSWPVNAQGTSGLTGGASATPTGSGLPVAVEVTLELEQWGEIRRIFPLSGEA